MDEPQTIVASADDRALSGPRCPRAHINNSAGQILYCRAAEAGNFEFRRSRQAGRGHFRAVYRGKLSDGVAIAVKVMKRGKQAASGSAAQSKYSGQHSSSARRSAGYRHPNIVALLGSCIGEGDSDLALLSCMNS